MIPVWIIVGTVAAVWGFFFVGLCPGILSWSIEGKLWKFGLRWTLAVSFVIGLVLASTLALAFDETLSNVLVSLVGTPIIAVLAYFPAWLAGEILG